MDTLFGKVNSFTLLFSNSLMISQTEGMFAILYFATVGSMSRLIEGCPTNDTQLFPK
jgi:hypothetical protein